MAEIAKWFVVHTYSGYENKVASNIATVVENRKMEDQILEIRIPTEKVISTVDKKITIVKVNKKGEEKKVESVKLEIERTLADGTKKIQAENVRIVKVETEEGAKNTLTVETADNEIFEYNIVRYDTDENGQQSIVIRFQKEVETFVLSSYVMVKVACTYKSHGEDDDEQEELSMSDEAWYIIRNTRGVTGFVGPGSKPVPLSDEEVVALGIEVKTIELNCKVGDYVTILSGPFDGFNGYVDAIDAEKNTVSVMVSMLGRDTPIELDINSVEVVEE